MNEKSIWEATETIESMLIPLHWRLVIFESIDPDVTKTYWCEAYLTVGHSTDELTNPSWQFRARTIEQGMAMLREQVEIERDVVEQRTGSRA